MLIMTRKFEIVIFDDIQGKGATMMWKDADSFEHAVKRGVLEVHHNGNILAMSISDRDTQEVRSFKEEEIKSIVG